MLTLSRLPSYARAERRALTRWRERGGLLVTTDRDAAGRLTLTALQEQPVIRDRQVVSLAALRMRVLEAAGRPAPEPQSTIGVRLGLQNAIRAVATPALGDSRNAPGFLATLERAVTEMREARLTPQEVRAAASDPIAMDVADLYDACVGVRSPVDDRWTAADAATAIAAFPPVTVVGFDDLAPPDWALLRALGDVEVAMAFTPGRHAHEARADRQAHWAAEAHVVNIAGDAPAAGLEALVGHLFEDRAPSSDAHAARIRLVAAAGTRGMHRAALLEVLDLHAAGVPLGRCAIVVPRLADARDDLDRLVADWGVPARRVTRRRVTETPLGTALLSLLRLGELDRADPGALDALLGWLRTPYSGADPAQVDTFERDARRGDVDTRRGLIGRWEDELMQPARRLVAASRQGPGAQVAALVDAGWAGLRRAAPGTDDPTRADVLDRLVIGALAGVGTALDQPHPPDIPPPARGPLPPGELGQLLADLTVPDEIGPTAGVALLDYATIRARRFQVVVACGLDGAGVPGRPAPDPMLAGLRAALGARLRPRASGTSESRLRFVAAVGAATEHLVLVRRAVDDDGRELAPSPYWMESCRVFGRAPGDLDRGMSARGDVLDDSDHAPTEREALRRLAVRGMVAPGALGQAASRRVRQLGVQAGTFDDVREISVTGVETFLRCPYGWLHDRYLRPEELQRPFDAAAEGTAGHDALCQVYQRMADRGTGACRIETLEHYLAELGRVLPGVIERYRPPTGGPAYDAFARRLDVYLRLLLRDEAEIGPLMTPHRFEWQLRDDGILEAPGPAMTLTGKADRIDRSTDGRWVVVVDYKRVRRAPGPARGRHQASATPALRAARRTDDRRSRSDRGRLLRRHLAAGP